MANMFDENGNYNKTEWKPGDRITAGKLNKIEESLEAINNNDIERHKEADERLDALEYNEEVIEERVEELEDLVADNKTEVDVAIYENNVKMDRLEQEMNEGIDTVEAIAHTVDDKIAEADASMKAQVNQGKADMEAMVAEVEADLEGLHAKDEELSAQLAQKVNNYCVNVCDFGCVGDGETDDTYNLQRAIDYAIENNLSIISPKNKIYAISEPITLLESNDILHLDFNKSTIKAINDMDYVLLYNCIDGTNDGGTIQNLYIDANEKASECIRFDYTRKTRILNCVMKNAKDKYVHVAGGNILVDGLYLDKRLYNYPNTTGIYIAQTSTDSKLNSIYMRDIKYGVVLDGGSIFMHQVHCYMLSKNLIEGSVFVTANQNVIISDCYADTYNIGFKINNGFFQMSNSHLWINHEFYNNSTCTNIPKVFEFKDYDRLKAFSINNCYFRFYEYWITTTKYGEFSNLDASEMYYKSIVDIQRDNYFSYCAKLPKQSFRNFKLYNLASSTSYEVYRNSVTVNGSNIIISLDFKFKTNFTEGTTFSLGNLPIDATYGNYSCLGEIYNDSTSYIQPISISSNSETGSIIKFNPVNSDCPSFRCNITIPLKLITSQEDLLDYDKRYINS